MKRVRKSVRLSTSEVAYRACENMVRERIDINMKLMQKNNSRIILPQLSLINVRGKPYRIMQVEVSFDLFNQCMKDTEYEIRGHGTERHKSVLGDPSEADIRTSLNLHEYRAFVKRLNEITGREFVIPTEVEWLKAYKSVKHKLLGDNWEWTETKIEGSRSYVLCSTLETDRMILHPETHYYCALSPYYTALRLVEYKYFRPLSSFLRFCVNFSSLLKFKEGSPKRI